MPIVDKFWEKNSFAGLERQQVGVAARVQWQKEECGWGEKESRGCKEEEEVSFCRSSNWKIVLLFFSHSLWLITADLQGNYGNGALKPISLSLFFLPLEQTKSPSLSVHPALWHDSVLPSICSPSLCLMWKWPSGKKDWIEEWRRWRINSVGMNTQNVGSQRDPGWASNMWRLIRFRLVALTTPNCAKAMEISACICR